MSDHVSEDLVAFLDGELPAARRAEVEAHLGGCPACAGERALLAGALGEVSAVAPVEPSADLRRKVLNGLDAAPVGLWPTLRERWFRALVLPVAAAAAVVLLLSQGTKTDPKTLQTAEEMEVATHLELYEDLDVLAAADVADIPPEDLDVVAHLDELGN